MKNGRTAGVVLAAIVGVLAAGSPAAADDDVIPGHRVDRPTDGLITGLALGGVLGASLIPVRADGPLWSRELHAADHAVRQQFSRRAAHVSDALLVASLAAPVAYFTGSTIEDADGDRLLLYGQSLAINGMLAQTVKHLVQRPRPYLYGKSSAARAYAARGGADSRMSFYSGHAALSFGAAVTGAYLLGASNEHAAARSVAWGAGLMVASATSNLRVRAGKHFYSDVVVGAAVGIAVGYLVPALHAEGERYQPSGQELALAGAGVFAGALISQLIPLGWTTEDDDPRRAMRSASRGPRFQLTPTPVANGMGFALAGTM